MLVSTPVRTVPRFDRIALAQAASPAPPRAAGVPRAVAASGLFDVLLEDACLLLAVVIVDIVTAVPSISRDAARIIAAAASVASLYFRTFSEPAATAAPRARASATATAAVERADEALLYARLRLPVVVGDVKSA